MTDVASNPILPGFNPDPSICRVGEDYYIATSTFEWYPGVQVHHSTDLVNWRLITRPLNEARLLDLRGVPDSCGVWAPCLSWHDGIFYLVFTVVNRFDGNYKDTHNYLTTSQSILGPWSDPLFLNSSGFDPSLFHDDDGRKWLVNMIWDHRPDRTFFGGILLQEYNHETRQLTGPIKNIFKGTALDCTEAPHLYKRGEYYYLMTAEGGTGYGHAITMARAKTLFGPYETDPQGPILTSRNNKKLALQRAGHGDWVHTPCGQDYIVHLCSRPLPDLEKLCSPLCRETAIQRAYWTYDGWLRLMDSDQEPQITFAPPTPTERHQPQYQRIHFEESLPLEFQWLRTPNTHAIFSLSAKPGKLRLYGAESIGSWFQQALVARRQEHWQFSAETALTFKPDNFQQMAGLVCYYNTHKFHYLYISHDETYGKHLAVQSCKAQQNWQLDFPSWHQKIPIEFDTVYLKAVVNCNTLIFYFSEDGDNWQPACEPLDYSIMCDEAGKGEGAQFSGTFIGMCCQDLSGQRITADFDYFEYQPIEDAS